MRFMFATLLLMIQPIGYFNQTAGGQALKAPDFVLKDINGKAVRLSHYKGKVVLVNFWATWCAPCRAEMPELVRWQKEHGRRGLQIIGITYPPYKSDRVRRLARQLNLNYPTLFGTRDVAGSYSAGDVLPVSIIIDRGGAIRGRILGVMDHDEFRQKVGPLLK
jgi:thiol-disulfide isomerase/thioredoxin